MIEIRGIDSSKEYKFNKNIEEEIIQNIENILSRYKGNIPFNRKKGIDSSIVDEPFQISQAKLTNSIIEEIERDESRFEVLEVIFKNGDRDGVYKTIVRGVIK